MRDRSLLRVMRLSPFGLVAWSVRAISVPKGIRRDTSGHGDGVLSIAPDRQYQAFHALAVVLRGHRRWSVGDADAPGRRRERQPLFLLGVPGRVDHGVVLVAGLPDVNDVFAITPNLPTLVCDDGAVEPAVAGVQPGDRGGLGAAGAVVLIEDGHIGGDLGLVPALGDLVEGLSGHRLHRDLSAHLGALGLGEIVDRHDDAGREDEDRAEQDGDSDAQRDQNGHDGDATLSARCRHGRSHDSYLS